MATLANVDDHETPHALYRFRNADGELLYLGRSNSPFRRADEHRHSKQWITQAVRIDLEWVPAELVRDFEREAIQAERPRFNIQHNGGRVRVEVEAEIPGSGTGLMALLAGSVALFLAAKWGADTCANWMVRRRAAQAGMQVDLPPVQNPFLADPPSVSLRLMYAAMAAASTEDDDEFEARYARLTAGSAVGSSYRARSAESSDHDEES
jgi:predicted GIY-YIG superfamily endonuclease